MDEKKRGKMKDKLNYSASIVSSSFLYVELKELCKLKDNNYAEKGIEKKIYEENIFYLNSKNRKRNISSLLFKRLKVLDEFLINELLESDIQVGKIINFYSILKTDKLYYEFMYEVYREKTILEKKFIDDKDFDKFFRLKKGQSDTIGNWKESTLKKVRQLYKRFIVSSGLGIRIGKEIKLKKVIIPEKIANHFKIIGEGVFLETISAVIV